MGVKMGGNMVPHESVLAIAPVGPTEPPVGRVNVAGWVAFSHGLKIPVVTDVVRHLLEAEMTRSVEQVVNAGVSDTTRGQMGEKVGRTHIVK
jgi:hypothetical protein